MVRLTILWVGALSVVAALSGSSPVEATGGVQPSAGRLLVARSELPDPNFFEAVVLLLDYDREQGALGVVINRRSGLAVNKVVPDGGLLSGRQDPLYLGGPVSLDTVTVLVRGTDSPESAAGVIPDVYLVRDRVGLEELVNADPDQGAVRFYAGYAGWAKGQLEDEISRGVWHLLPGEPRWVFSDEPGKTWDRLLDIIFGPTA